MKLTYAVLLLLPLSPLVHAQTSRDSCHVYIVEPALVARTVERFHEANLSSEDPKLRSAGQKVFTVFQPTPGDEQLTTKHYPFPGSKLIITASVYYTDNSMNSRAGGGGQVNNQSVLLGILVSSKPEPSAVSADSSAVSEVTYKAFNKARAKRYVRVSGRQFLVGLECEAPADATIQRKQRVITTVDGRPNP